MTTQRGHTQTQWELLPCLPPARTTFFAHDFLFGLPKYLKKVTSSSVAEAEMRVCLSGQGFIVMAALSADQTRIPWAASQVTDVAAAAVHICGVHGPASSSALG